MKYNRNMIILGASLALTIILGISCLFGKKIVINGLILDMGKNRSL